MLRYFMVTCALLIAMGQVYAASDVDALRAEIQRMRELYEKRLVEMEHRLREAEIRATEQAKPASELAVTTPSLPKNSSDSVNAGNAFNPQISVILDGNYYHDNKDGKGTELLGEADGISHAHGAGDDHHGHTHGGAEQGFNFRSAEIALSASVDAYFDATALLAIESDGSLELEEAWFQTRSLPYGLKIKAGKFLSDIGYMNNQHPHTWDFTDQNLAYLNLLGGHGLRDTGVQITWLPNWRYYTLFGLEVFQGEQEKLGALAEIDEPLEAELEGLGLSHANLALSDEKHGPRLYTAFIKYAPELGYSHALQLGLWGAWADQHQEIHGEVGGGNLHTLEGNAWMWGLDAVYKYDAGGAYGQGNFKLQGEYLWQRKDLDLKYRQTAGPLDERIFTEDGFYLQGLYGFAPRWQIGLRYDMVGLTNKLESNGNRVRDWDSSRRWTAGLTWSLTEFSQLRLQYSKADISINGQSNNVDYVYLQYLMSLGSHGAHKF
ncbi:hypothetical protein TI04_03820 [Achromatium sp. WMS2]|nr:hypothetical protein TI04_03820 [Achromatium sp. WMS2]